MTPSQPRSPYLVNATVDCAMIGGLSIAAYFALRLLAGRAQQLALTTFTFWSYSWLINGTHFAATNYRLYRSSASIKQYPLTAAMIPLVIGAGLYASLRWPATLAPFFVKLFVFWSPYHYSGQSLGLTTLYARRSGVRLTRAERLALAGFIYATFMAAAVRVETRLGPGDYYGMTYPTLGLPAWAWPAALGVMIACGLSSAGLLARRRLVTGRSLPAIALLPAAAQFVWAVLGPGVPAFFALVPMFHGLQYLLVAWFMQAQTNAQERTSPLSRWGLSLETGRWLAWNVAGYFFLFWAIPKGAAAFSGEPILFAAPVALAAVQIHHFFVDGVIWRLRDPRVGEPLSAALA